MREDAMPQKKVAGGFVEFFLKSLMNLAGLIFGFFVIVAGSRSTPPASWIAVIFGMLLMLGAARELTEDFVKFRSERSRL